MSSPVVVSQREGVAIIRMNVPSKLNALDPTGVALLIDAVERACGSHRIRAIVITGGERAFCSGEDLEVAAGLTCDEFDRQAADYQRLARTLLETDKPTIAAVAGVAFGGGLELALNCDVRIASADARFACPEAQWGLTVSNASSLLLRQCVGEGWARELVIFGRVLDAQDALSIGLVTRVVETGTVVDEAIKVASAVALAPVQGVAYAKQLLRASAPGTDAALALESELLSASFRVPETVDRITSFVAGKRESRP
ncbi:enoyl-CoA hydratase/isomerase family protein [Streptomyces sp. NPDC004609]|uniref:enoyl-CoA hydratase/isomerase family protein n=1 Tax=Streptomyces sp. NPDC004609 TaxID=3364704 RepID=UPI00367D0E71